MSGQTNEKSTNQRQALIVKPLFTYDIPIRRDQTSWRSWGGIQTEKDAAEEIIRIQDELLWRFRALCGLKNTLNSRIIAIGGFAAWSQPVEVIQKLVREKFRLDVQTLSYDDLDNGKIRLQGNYGK